MQPQRLQATELDLAPASAVDTLRADRVLVRGVYLFGRDFGYVQISREDAQGFELLEVEW